MFEIEHLKSGLSLSTHMGCPLNCNYCILNSLPHFSDSPQLIAEPKQLVDILKKEHTLFLNGKTPLIINNRTDPFLPDVLPYTIELLKRLCALNISSPIIIITKICPSISGLENLFKELKIVILYSYSDLDGDYNYNKIDDIKDIRQKFRENAVFHYYRPIIPYVNDDMEFILKTIDLFRNNSYDGTIISGFRLTEHNKYLVRNNSDHTYSNHKIFDNNIYLRVVDEMERQSKNYNIFRHTSCAIDYYMQRKNRLNYYRQYGQCTERCANYDICSNHVSMDLDLIMSSAESIIGRKISYKCNNNTVEVEDELNQEEIAFIRNAYGIIVKAERIKNSPSEVFLV